MKLLAHDRVGRWAAVGQGAAAVGRAAAVDASSAAAAMPPVLLLHGIGGGRALWLGMATASPAATGVAQRLAALGHDVAAADLPGYGESGSAVGLKPCEPACMAKLVALLIEHWGRGPAVVVGHSMGGMVALELWAHRPDLVAGLVLACSSAAFGKPDGDWQAKFVADRLAPLDAGLGMAGLARQLVPGMVAQPPSLELPVKAASAPSAPTAVADAAIAVMQQVPEATYRTVLQGIVSFDQRALLPTITVPTLCIAGDQDRTAPPHVMQGVADRIPGAAYAGLAPAGHLAPFEQPLAFADAVHAFVARRSAAASPTSIHP
jgi:pimeloyl-ACP methyl ester carboxylesterase